MNMLIFLNLMIAVIGDVYESVMETRTEESFKKTAEMIAELNLVFGKLDRTQLNSSKLIITREVAKDADENSQWQGFVLAVRRMVIKS